MSDDLNRNNGRKFYFSVEKKHIGSLIISRKEDRKLFE